MANDSYSVSINRSEGAVEISGPDKAWVAEQLDKVTDVIGSVPGPDTGGSDAGSSSTEQKPKRRRSARKASGAGNGVKISSADELKVKLTSDVQKKLDAFKAEREAHFKSAQDQAAIIATFLEDELKLPGMDAHELAAVFDVMGWRAPANTRAVINNARDRNHYFRGWSHGKASLSAQGKNFGRIDSKKKPDDKS